MVIDFAFYLFSGVLILSSLAVILSRNPIYSVLFLILAFFNSSGLFLLANAEFLAMLLVIVYVGAVALLFLFVIMMLNIDYQKMDKEIFSYLPLGIVVVLILFFEIIVVMNSVEILQAGESVLNISKRYLINQDETNTYQIGKILYTEFFLHFQLAALILLVAMIGSVVLAHRKRDGLKRQVIAKQVSRKRSDSVKVVKILSHKGI
ncbi:MAG: NADH-quinone oxidoreductase subunit J [Rickettsiales bacterium]|mgnify:FL=1|jgi:NADH-quinone oxidoreductase subunit J|nr:NADH-quinone oxidoreductase subunit J [Rickettsiales bacterium]